MNYPVTHPAFRDNSATRYNLGSAATEAEALAILNGPRVANTGLGQSECPYKGAELVQMPGCIIPGALVWQPSAA